MEVTHAQTCSHLGDTQMRRQVGDGSPGLQSMRGPASLQSNSKGFPGDLFSFLLLLPIISVVRYFKKQDKD